MKRVLFSIFLLLLSGTLIFSAGMKHDSLINLRASYHLDSAPPLENAPPLMVFTTVVLGGFRGLISDLLWLRISNLQEQAKFFEIVQLSDWVTKLEPRCTDIWAFHGWNMAYNISIMMSDGPDRWRWLRNGVGILRDDGVRYNPGDARLYFGLGWFFHDRMGRTLDPFHKYFKKEWAKEIALLFDGPRPDYDEVMKSPELKRKFEEEYELIPDLMVELEEKYGPLDWRMPDTHALYWAYRGKKQRGESGQKFCDILIRQSLAAIRKNESESGKDE